SSRLHQACPILSHERLAQRCDNIPPLPARVFPQMNRSTKVLLLAFVLLSAVDFVQTYRLLRLHEAWIYEANPVANTFFELAGPAGLAIFKASVVIVVGLVGFCLAP